MIITDFPYDTGVGENGNEERKESVHGFVCGVDAYQQDPCFGLC